MQETNSPSRSAPERDPNDPGSTPAIQSDYFCASISRNRILSNFIRVDEGIYVPSTKHTFLTVEAAYVHLVRFRGAMIHLFEKDGVFATIENFMTWWNGLHGDKPTIAFNPKYWADKSADGIVAKTVTGKTPFARFVRSKFDLPNPNPDDYIPTEHDKIWRELHEAKFSASKSFRDTLLATNGKFLYEFDRAGGRKTTTGKQPIVVWGGCFVSDENNIKRFRGKNVMGQMLMRLRDAK